MVELKDVGKYFPSNGVTALEKANLSLHPGEIHALLGENGSGKSTLMHIMAGYFLPSSGNILVDGKERHFSAPAAALALGIGMVRQNPGFVKGFKAWEDCILGAENKSSRYPSLFLHPGLSRKRCEELSNQWRFDLPLDAEAESLPVSQRLKAAVLSLLLRDVKWFIFDEPTAVLTPAEAKTLFELFRRLRSEGKGIVLITHKLEEAMEISDRVTIMRRGVTDEPRYTGELSVEGLKNLVSGGAKGDSHHLPHFKGDSHLFQPVLEVKNLKIELPHLPHLRNVNLSLMPGKILGILGVRESGLETLELAVAGLLDFPVKNRVKDRGKCEGTITLNGRDITGKGVRAFRKAGGAYLGADRLGGNLAPELPLSDNLDIHSFRRARRWIFLDLRALDSWRRKIINRAGITRPLSDRADSFSGGMIQRVLLVREFAEEPSLLVLAGPGSSLDEANFARLTRELRALAGRGASALLFSTDMDELNSAADEILQLKNGTLAWNGGNNEN